MFKTERDFAKSLSTRLKQQGFDITRIESHSTGVGIPDMFVQGHGFDVFIELKNCPKVSVNNTWISPPYRPGQIAWHFEYYIKHNKAKCVLTICALLDGYVIIRGNSLSGTLNMTDENSCLLLKDLKNLSSILYEMSRGPCSKDNQEEQMI